MNERGTHIPGPTVELVFWTLLCFGLYGFVVTVARNEARKRVAVVARAIVVEPTGPLPRREPVASHVDADE